MKKFLSLFLCLILLFGLLPLTAPAKADSSGDWEYTTYIGQDYATITKYTGSGGDVTIPSTLGGKPVTKIGDRAFLDCTGLTGVTIPGSVTSIGHFAFQDCSGLTSVTIPDSVTIILFGIFSGCTGLTSAGPVGSGCSIEFEWVDRIPSNAFYKCTTLTSVTIPGSVTSIGDGAFSGCTGLTRVDISDLAAWCGIKFGSSYANPLEYAHVLYLNGQAITRLTIPSGVTNISDYAFCGCSTLKSAVIPNSVTSIGDWAFYDCTNLTSVTIPDSVTSIGSYAFWKCTGLTSVTMGKGVTSIGGFAFSDCTNLTSVTIPDSVTSIGDCAFKYCTGLTDVTIGNSVTMIGGGAFSGCTGLTSITIPDSVTKIGSEAFYNCSKLTTVTIGDGVTSVGESAFYHCDNLIRVNTSDLAAWCEIEFGSYDANPLAYAHVLHLNGNPVTNLTIPDEVTCLGKNVFSNCSSLTYVTIPNSVTSINRYAFTGCTGLISTGPKGSGCSIQFSWTDSIPDNAFSSMYSLRAAVIPATVTEIRQDAFSYCSNLQHVYYGGTAEQWEEILVFGGNDSLLSAELHCGYQIGNTIVLCSGNCGEGLTWTLDQKGKLTVSGSGEISGSAFNDSTYRDLIRTAVLETGVTGISYSAFYNCSSLTSVTIPGSVTSIEYGAFKDCTGLTSVTIPGSITEIGYGAFSGCTGLKDVYYGGTEEDWGKINIISGNDPLTSATIHYAGPLVISSVKANKTTASTGETITWTAAATGGTGALQYCFFLYKDGTKVKTRAYSTTKTFSYTPTEPGTYKVKVYVKDTEGTKVYKASKGVTVAAAAASVPVISSVKAGVTSAYAGEKITWTATASGGAGILQYYFILYKDGTKVKTQAYSTKNTFSYAPKGAGTFKVKVYVKDAADAKVSKTSAGVTVTAAAASAPVISSVKAGVTSANAGEKITWTAAASGGSGTLKYYFILYKDGVKLKTRSYSTTRTFSYTPTEAGSYKVKVYVKDSTGAKSYKLSGKVAVTLGPPAILSVKAGKTSSAVGEEITWTAAAVGSEQPLKYYFVLYKDGAKIKTRTYSTANTFSYTPTEAGTYKVRVYVKDAEGTKVSKLSGGVTVSVLNPGQQQSGIKLTNGNPSGNAKTISFTTRNELTGGKSGTARAFTAQPLDNGYTRFSLSYSIPEQMFISVFSPPDGALFMLLGQTENAGNSGNLIFDLKNKDLNAIDEVSIKFYQSDSEAFWVFFFTDQLK